MLLLTCSPWSCSVWSNHPNFSAQELMGNGNQSHWLCLGRPEMHKHPPSDWCSLESSKQGGCWRIHAFRKEKSRHDKTSTHFIIVLCLQVSDCFGGLINLIVVCFIANTWRYWAFMNATQMQIKFIATAGTSQTSPFTAKITAKTDIWSQWTLKLTAVNQCSKMFWMLVVVLHQLGFSGE